MSFVILALFYLLFYSLKIRITTRLSNKARSIAAYVVVFAVSFVFVALVIAHQVDRFDNPGYRWIGAPIHFLTIPTVTYVYDLVRRKKLSDQSLIIRSVVEVVVIFPIWFIFMLFLVFSDFHWIACC